jgi:hypothetical protein
MIENHGPDCQCQVIWEGAMTRLRSVAHPCQELQVVRHCVEEKNHRVPLPCLQRLLHVTTHVGEIWSCGVTSSAGGGGDWSKIGHRAPQNYVMVAADHGFLQLATAP